MSDLKSKPKIVAEIVMLTSSQGGRSRGIQIGPDTRYMPHVVVDDRSNRTARRDAHHASTEHYMGVLFEPALAISDSSTGSGIYPLRLICHPLVDCSSLKVGTTFTIREGGRVVGHGVVIERPDLPTGLSSSVPHVHEQTPATDDPTADPLEKRRFRFTLKQLLLAVTAVAILLAIYVGLFRKVVTIRPALSDDAIREQYFGIDEDAEIRAISIVEGSFTKSTWLSASLVNVEGGKIQEINRFTVGRSPNRIGSPMWQTLTITLALGSRDTPIGRVVQLGSVGHSRGSGAGGEWPIAYSPAFSYSFTGSITPGRDHIIYAEGDTRIDMNPKMTITEFAQKNRGNYLVVKARLN